MRPFCVVLVLAVLVSACTGGGAADPSGVALDESPEAPGETDAAEADGSPDQVEEAEAGEAPTESGEQDPVPLTDPPADDEFDRSEVVLRGPGGEAVDVPVYVADEPSLRRQGLMHREELAAGAGMVFVFPWDRRGGFWMKNTRIPLSIAFFDGDGTVLAILDMEPCEVVPCPSYDPEVTYRGALEVNQGFFDEFGVDEQWRIDLPDGMRARS